MVYDPQSALVAAGLVHTMGAKRRITVWSRNGISPSAHLATIANWK